ncbi:hypothetical protein J6590_032082 [Homalodisca vitripennis]|nr:hypothetical protein J6590_032082 [Homalodisca vitripennis]
MKKTDYFLKKRAQDLTPYGEGRESEIIEELEKVMEREARQIKKVRELLLVKTNGTHFLQSYAPLNIDSGKYWMREKTKNDGGSSARVLGLLTPPLLHHINIHDVNIV